MVDPQFRATVVEALAQVCPLFDADVVDLIEEKGFAMKPKNISGWDLTQISSVQVSEGVQQSVSPIPPVSGKTLNGFTFRTSLIASIEAEEDIANVTEKMARAFAIGWARGAGDAITNGTGSGQPGGIYYSAPSSGVTLGVSSGKISAAEINALFFSVNRIHRASDKCAWLMPDSVYKAIRNSTDTSGRPLLSMHHDDEVLLGRPVYITPDLPEVGGSPIANGALIFGDLSKFTVRISAPWVVRTWQTGSTSGSIVQAEATFHGRLRVDSYLFDASNGAVPPIVSAAAAHQ
jgi:HK97 family phage major capsid protein